MKVNKRIRAAAGCLGLGLLSVAPSAFADWDLNMTQGVTGISHKVYDLHMMILIVCAIIGVVVYGAMFWSIVNHRKSKHPTPAQFHHSTTVEIVWTVIPFLILVGMAIPAASTLIQMEDTSDSAMTVKITGYQWKWRYDYVDQGVGFYSTLDAKSNAARQLHSGIDPNTVPHYLLNVDHPLVLPVDTKIRFLITSGDVIHSWWMPALGFKKDAIPGYINAEWTKIDKPGTYRGQCAELCGRDHGFMPIVVVAKSKADFQKWLDEQKKGGENGSAQQASTGAGEQPVQQSAKASAEVVAAK